MTKRFGKKDLWKYTCGLKVVCFSDFDIQVEQKRGGGRVKFPARFYIPCSDPLEMFITIAGEYQKKHHFGC